MRVTRGAIVILLCVALFACDGGESVLENTQPVRIGSKNFTEQFILAEMMAQLIENQTDVRVERRFNLGGTMICHGALINGEIDLYAEYTGTALTAILGEDAASDSAVTFDHVGAAYQERFACRWLEPFGFNNTYAITVRRDGPLAEGWETISDLEGAAPNLRAGFTAEFSERPDGYPGLRDAYEFAFGSVRDLDPGLMYRAIAADEVDVICAFATDGRIAAYDLKPLRDDRGFFPPYEAAPVIRVAVLNAHLEIVECLGLLAGALDDATMQSLNFEVDENQRSEVEVAREFLESSGLLVGG